jgi:hypothetical protein
MAAAAAADEDRVGDGLGLYGAKAETGGRLAADALDDSVGRMPAAYGSSPSMLRCPAVSCCGCW